MKKLGIMGLVSCCIVGLLGVAAAAEVTWQDIGGGNTSIKAVLVHPQDPRIIYIGSSSGVLKSEDSGKAWRSVLTVGGQNRAVNFLGFGLNADSIYAATSAGLYYSANNGKNWKRIFQGKNNLEKECSVVASLPYGIILGTKAGLFLSTDRGRSWHKARASLGSSHILAIACYPKEADSLYVACVDGVFRSSDQGQNWEKIFVARPTEDGLNEDEAIEDQDEEERFSQIRYLCIDPQDPDILYLATEKGVYISQDKGKSWKAMPSFGLLKRQVKFLLVLSKSDIYAVNRSGIFQYNQDRWEELSLGLAVNEVRFLSLDKQNSLYAATEKGLFKAEAKVYANSKQSRLVIYPKNEPDIKKVQQAAIRYAEVGPEKIIKWRKQAAKKAWLPKVSASLNRDIADLWHWESGSTTKAEDDALRRGHDAIGWDVSLSWDLGELIWNQDQTSIDVRSKLMVQLRGDILDEVTKLYFERLRLKIELDNIPIGDNKKIAEKELRIEELTASLDALSGGYFSSTMSNPA